MPFIRLKVGGNASRITLVHEDNRQTLVGDAPDMVVSHDNHFGVGTSHRYKNISSHKSSIGNLFVWGG